MVFDWYITWCDVIAIQSNSAFVSQHRYVTSIPELAINGGAQDMPHLHEQPTSVSRTRGSERHQEVHPEFVQLQGDD